MIPPNFTAVDFRAYQNEVGNSIATGIIKAGVKFVVNLSSQGAEFPAGTGPIAGLHDQEERLNRLQGVNVLHLRATYFIENLLMNIPQRPDGTLDEECTWILKKVAQWMAINGEGLFGTRTWRTGGEGSGGRGARPSAPASRRRTDRRSGRRAHAERDPAAA